MIQLDYDRFTGHKRQFFDTEWNRMDVSFHFPSDNKVIEKPAQLDEMLSLAKTLSKGFPQLRTDFYIVGGKIYVGEMTFFHGTGMGRWTPDSFDKTLGSWLDLSEISKGKMFGVLVCEDSQTKERGFLAAFSGTLDRKTLLPYFVPPVFDLMAPGSYFKEEEKQ